MAVRCCGGGGGGGGERWTEEGHGLIVPPIIEPYCFWGIVVMHGGAGREQQAPFYRRGEEGKKTGNL